MFLINLNDFISKTKTKPTLEKQHTSKVEKCKD